MIDHGLDSHIVGCVVGKFDFTSAGNLDIGRAYYPLDKYPTPCYVGVILFVNMGCDRIGIVLVRTESSYYELPIAVEFFPSSDREEDFVCPIFPLPSKDYDFTCDYCFSHRFTFSIFSHNSRIAPAL